MTFVRVIKWIQSATAFWWKKKKIKAELHISNNSILCPLVFHGAIEREKYINWNNFTSYLRHANVPESGCFASLKVPLLTFDDEMWKITQGAVYPLASLSIQLSWLIPEYCSHFSPPLLRCQVALSAFLTKFQGGSSGLSVSHRCTNKEQLFLFSFSFPQKATLKYRLWKQAVLFSALEKRIYMTWKAVQSLPCCFKHI